MAGGRVRIDRRLWNRVAKAATNRSASRAADNAMQLARMEIVMAGRVRTGAMREGYRKQEVPRPGNDTGYRIFNITKQHVFQNDGTRGSKAKKGSALTIFPKGGAMIFRTRSGPIAPGRFLFKALSKMKIDDWVE